MNLRWKIKTVSIVRQGSPLAFSCCLLCCFFRIKAEHNKEWPCDALGPSVGMHSFLAMHLLFQVQSKTHHFADSCCLSAALLGGVRSCCCLCDFSFKRELAVPYCPCHTQNREGKRSGNKIRPERQPEQMSSLKKQVSIRSLRISDIQKAL